MAIKGGSLSAAASDTDSHEPNHHLRRYASTGFRANVTLALIRQIAAIVVGLILAVVVARALGPTQNGFYTLAALLPVFVATLLSTGIPPANVYFVGRGDFTASQAAAANVQQWIVLSCVGLLSGALSIVFLGDRLFPGVPQRLLWLGLVAFPMVLLQQFFGSLLQARQDFRKYNTTLLIAPGSTLALTVLALYVLRTGLAGAMLAFVIGQLIALVFTVQALGKELNFRGIADENRSYRKASLRYGALSHLTNISVFLLYRVDVYLINWIIGALPAGIYAVAVQLAERVWLLSQAVTTVMLPRLVELHADESARRALTPLISRWVSVLSVVAAVILASFGWWAIKALFGPEYSSAYQALLWLLPGIIAGNVGRILSNDIAARGRPDINLHLAIFAVVVNVAANLYLIPRMGINGAALATSIAYVLNAFVKAIIYRRITRTRWADLMLVPASELRALCADMKARLVSTRMRTVDSGT